MLEGALLGAVGGGAAPAAHVTAARGVLRRGTTQLQLQEPQSGQDSRCPALSGPAAGAAAAAATEAAGASVAAGVPTVPEEGEGDSAVAASRRGSLALPAAVVPASDAHDGGGGKMADTIALALAASVKRCVAMVVPCSDDLGLL